MSSLKKIFKKNKSIIIGAIHFPPLLGYKDFPGMKLAVRNALQDLEAFEKGGVDGIIFENNYDLPHKIFVDREVVACMIYLGGKIKNKTKLPVGISVLWNDYKTALSIAKILNLQFIRIPVFIDTVKTDYGVIKGVAKEIVKYKKSINADGVAVFTDIHVKHAKLLNKDSITNSAHLAVKNGSDAIIITGGWTGQAPSLDDLQNVRSAINNFPIIAGSGVNSKNIRSIAKYTNGVIVSSSLKKGKNNKLLVNIKKWQQRIDLQKVRQLTKIKKIM